MSLIIEIVLLSVLLGTVILHFFKFLGWLSKDSFDHIVRDGLEKGIYLKLEEMSLFARAVSSLKHIVRKIRAEDPRHIRNTFLTWALIFNFIGVLLGTVSIQLDLKESGHVVQYQLEESSIDWDSRVFWAKVFAHFPPTIQAGSQLQRFIGVLIWMSFFILAGILFDVFSLYVTWKLITLAIESTSLFRLLLHLIIDVAMALISLFWAMLPLGLLYSWLEHQLVAYVSPADILQNVLTFWQSAFKAIWTLEWIADPEIYGVTRLIFSLGFSAVIPSLIYIGVLGILVFLHFIPEWLRNFIQFVLLKIIIDLEKPIFTQLGIAAGAAGASLSALARLAIAFF